MIKQYFSKLSSVEVLISKALIGSNISHHELVLINVMKEFYIKEEMKNYNNKQKLELFT